MFSIDGTEPGNIEAIVMNRQLLGFDHIFVSDAIRVTSGITITPTGVVSFAGRKKCTAIGLNEPNFSRVFDQIQNC